MSMYRHLVLLLLSTMGVLIVHSTLGIQRAEEWQAATRVSINWPLGLAMDSSGQLYIAESKGGRVLILDTNRGRIRPLIRQTPQAEKLSHPLALAIDSKSDLWVLDTVGGAVGVVNSRNGEIIKVISGETNRSGVFNRPQAIVISAKDEIYVTEWVPGSSRPPSPGHGVFRFDSRLEILNPIIGTGAPNKVVPPLSFPTGLALSSSNKLYVADGGNNRILECDLANKRIRIVATKISGVNSLALDGATLYFTEATPRVRAIDLRTGVISVVAGGEVRGFSGDGGPATAAKMVAPAGIAVDRNGNVFISDFWDNRIRKVNTRTGIISTVAGNGTPVRPDIEKEPHK